MRAGRKNVQSFRGDSDALSSALRVKCGGQLLRVELSRRDGPMLSRCRKFATFASILILSLLPLTSSYGQQFATVPDRSVIGRIGTGSGAGPSQAIPFTTLQKLIGTGNVIGPDSSVDNHVALFSGTSGAILKDGGSLSPVATSGVFSDLSGTSGIESNVINLITANYTIQTSDCGKTVMAGSGASGLFTITLPSISGFPSPCTVKIKNGDTGRGKILSGFPANTNGILWPQQTLVVSIGSGGWVTTQNPGRWRVTSALTVFIDIANGNDANDGLAPGASGAIKTRQLAWSNAVKYFDGSNQVLTFQYAAGTYTDGFDTGFLVPNFFNVILQGDTTTPTNVVVSPTTAGVNGFTFSSPQCVALQGFSIGANGGFGIYSHTQGCVILTGNNNFQSVGTGIHMAATKGYIFIPTPYTVSGSGSVHVFSGGGSLVEYGGSYNVAVSGSQTFTLFAQAITTGSITVPTTVTFSGAVIGTRYAASTNAVISTGQGANAFPGTVAGSMASGGQYN